MLNDTTAIVNPESPEGSPPLPSLAVMVGSLPDLTTLCGCTGLNKAGFKSLITSRLYTNEARTFALTGPIIGAPYAVILLETLIARGARTILFLGWCGAISPKVNIGDVIVPTAAVIDEGTSLHYRMKTGDTVFPGNRVTGFITQQLTQQEIPFHTGAIWTTDAIYRETRDRVIHFQRQHTLAVEMELSALFTVGKFRDVEVGAVLVVSDSLASLSWQQGFTEKCFKTRRRAICDVIGRLCREQTGLRPAPAGKASNVHP
jgi:uridine phosphorylase